jgi:sulfite reductase beta subunit-like hemoprotein
MTDELSRNERIKEASTYLRGTLADGLTRAETGAIAEDDQQLVKFHGMYLQDDRDLRPERTRKKLEKAYSFMIRLRIPGGVCTPEQWLKLDRIARDYANGTLRLTTRQTFQYHGVIKSNLKRTMQAIDAALLDTLAACGDVNRNVLASSNPHRSGAHAGPMRWPGASRIISCPRRRLTARSGSTARRSRAASPRRSRSTAAPICRGSSRQSWRCPPTTMWTSSPRISASSRCSTMPEH